MEEKKNENKVDEGNLKGIAGGSGSSLNGREVCCPECRRSDCVTPTGNKDTESLVIPMYEWKCNYCGEVFWSHRNRQPED
jgi:hypothetical protein